jgi:hypothetical protein
MALHDYAAIDEGDFYGQGFEQDGVVSVWVGLSNGADDREEIDVLQDLCGIGCYEASFASNPKSQIPNSLLTQPARL